MMRSFGFTQNILIFLVFPVSVGVVVEVCLAFYFCSFKLVLKVVQFSSEIDRRLILFY